jgi:hypothetical protein
MLDRDVHDAARDVARPRPSPERARPRRRARPSTSAASRASSVATAPGVSIAVAICAVASTVGLKHFLKDPFEYNFYKLTTKTKTTEEAKEFGKSFDKLFGRWPSPTIVLADSLEQVEPVKNAIRKQDDAQAQKRPDPKRRAPT